jgi:hypothetical protein
MIPMKPAMETARTQLLRFLEQHEPTAGMYVRMHGDHLIVGRDEPQGHRDAKEEVDRVRLTRLANSSYGLSVRRHTGRWEKTPFSGPLKEMVEVMATFMQHLVAPY